MPAPERAHATNAAITVIERRLLVPARFRICSERSSVWLFAGAFMSSRPLRTRGAAGAHHALPRRSPVYAVSDGHRAPEALHRLGVEQEVRLPVWGGV